MMEQNFLAASVASVFACAVTTAGILVIRRYKEWTQRNTVYFICFAAGVLISVSFLHIVPTAFAMNVEAPTYLLAGYLAMLGFDRFLTAYVCDRPVTSDYALGLLPLLGIGFHSYLDGVIYAISFSVGTLTGALVALGMVLHEFPEGVVTYALLLRSGFSERMSFVLAFAAAAVTTPLGTFTSFAFVSRISEPALGLLLALSAGTLVYVGATHLLPRAEREPRRYSLIALVVGVLVAVGIILSKG
jgi:zinc and cadmium transporter